MAHTYALFSWIGGKTHQLNTIKSAVAPWMVDCQIWCEPFFGSGKVWGSLVSAGMTRSSLIKPTATRLVAGDVAPETVAALKTSRDHPRELAEALQRLDAERLAIPLNAGDTEAEIAAGRVTWYNAIRDSYSKDQLTTPELVARWLTVCRLRTSFGLCHEKPSAWFKELMCARSTALADRVPFWSKSMAGSDYELRPWQDTIRRLPSDCSHVIVYADPPYLAGEQGFYGVRFSLADQEALIDALNDVHDRGGKIAYSNSLVDSAVAGSEEWYRERFSDGAVITRLNDYQSIHAGANSKKRQREDCLILLG